MDKLVYGALLKFLGDNIELWPSQATISKQIGASRNSVLKSLKHLERYGLVGRVAPAGKNRLNHKTNRYHLLWHEVYDKAQIATSGSADGCTSGCADVLASGSADGCAQRDKSERDKSERDKNKTPLTPQKGGALEGQKAFLPDNPSKEEQFAINFITRWNEEVAANGYGTRLRTPKDYEELGVQVTDIYKKTYNRLKRMYKNKNFRDKVNVIFRAIQNAEFFRTNWKPTILRFLGTNKSTERIWEKLLEGHYTKQR